MRFKYILAIFSYFLLPVLIAGCANFGVEKGVKWDLPGICENIERPEPLSAVDDPGITGQTQAIEENLEVVPVRDINTSIRGSNPLLDKIRGGGQKSQPSVDNGISVKPGEGVLLNFDNADIYEVIQVIAEILDISYIIDPQVKGVVNIRSGKQIPMSQLEVVFRKLLNINGMDIRSEGDYNYIYLAPNPGSNLVFGPESADKRQDSSRFIIQIVPVVHMSGAGAQKLLAPYTSDQGRIEILDNSNTLFITDYESKVVDILAILAQLDVSPLSSLNVRLVKVAQAPLFDLRDELDSILEALKINVGNHDGVTVLALERANSILLVSSNNEILDVATRWITDLDVVPTEGRDNIYIYNVRNSVATELASLVNELLGDGQGSSIGAAASQPSSSSTSTTTTDTTADTSATTITTSTAPAVTKTGKVMVGADDGSSGMRWAGKPILIADDSRNIILLRALPSDYNRLLKLLEKLDNMPRQVLIEVMVAEVALSDRWELGVEWTLHKQGVLDGRAYQNNLTNNTNSISNGSTDAAITHSGLMDTAAGITYSILNSAGEVASIINAIADDTEISILSSPQVMVLNNETATVNVGEQVPIVTSQTGDISSDNLNQTIQYKDTGVILTVTPKINYDGIIILEINQQVSSAGTNTLSGTASPVISNREISTKLAVRNGQTVFMGGLIENNINLIDSGVPFLKDIPYLGWAFKYQSQVKEKTELLVMITPYVIESEDVLQQYVAGFNAKMQELRDKLAE